MKIRDLTIVLSALLVVSFFAGCGGAPQKVILPANVSADIAVLSLGADTSSLNQDQIDLLQRSLDWMDRDIISSLARKGFNAFHIKNEDEFTGAGNSHLLKIAITDHKMIPKGARFLAGMMAGADRLNAHYDLVNAKGETVLSWDDVQASTKGGTYCAQTLNRNAVEKVATFLSAQ